MNYQEQYQAWLTNPYFDEETKAELKAIANDDKEIKERFYKDLEFGTAGLRGVIGAGTNRMNIYTVRKATQGLANYIMQKGFASKGVAIAYDSRRMSPEFANEAALCLAANGIKAYIFDSLRPTPELSFAVRELSAFGGVVITASHNPPEYNGYKLYDERGCQLVPSVNDEVVAEIEKIEDPLSVKALTKAEAGDLIVTLDKDIDEKYYNAVMSVAIHPDVNKIRTKTQTMRFRADFLHDKLQLRYPAKWPRPARAFQTARSRRCGHPAECHPRAAG